MNRHLLTRILQLDGAANVAAGVAVGVAILDPTGAEAWARWAIAVVADLSAVVGLVKLAGTRRLAATAAP